MTDPSPLPPPPPPRLEDLEAPKASRTPFVAMTVGALLLACVMGFLWLGARSSGSDAAFERDAAVTERDAANVANIEASAQLQATQDELADARAALEDTAGETDGTSEANPKELQELKDQAEELAAEVERLEDENAMLAADLAAAETNAEPADTTPPATDVPETTTTTTTTTTVAPETTTIPAPATTAPPSVDPGDIGEQIAGLFRPRVIGSLQELCLGGAVLEALGQPRVVEALASDSPGDDEEFVETILAALPGCNIDPSAIFG